MYWTAMAVALTVPKIDSLTADRARNGGCGFHFSSPVRRGYPFAQETDARAGTAEGCVIRCEDCNTEVHAASRSEVTPKIRSERCLPYRTLHMSSYRIYRRRNLCREAYNHQHVRGPVMTESRIRALYEQLVRAEDETVIEAVAKELRLAIQAHVGELRRQVQQEYPKPTPDIAG